MSNRWRTGCASLAGIATAMVCAALALPAGAAPEPPDCTESLDVHGRPGMQRAYGFYCDRATTIEVLDAPEHATATVRRTYYSAVYLEVKPAADAPREDHLVLRATGPGGTQDIPVQLHITPLSENTAPVCEPVEAALRTAGTEPAIVHLLWPSCWDNEQDPVTIEGTGPGLWHDTPRLVDQYSTEAEHFWYETKISRGQEMTGYHATDWLGARSQTAPVSVMVGPDVDHPTFCYDYEIYSRPGRTRTFSVSCEDRDPDPFTMRLKTPPSAGAVTQFKQFTIVDYGGEYWAGANITYDPFGESTEEDSLVYTAVWHRARPVEATVRIQHREAPANIAPSCGGDDGRGYQNHPRTFWMGCGDLDGDDVSVEVVRQPEHGRLSPFQLTKSEFGGTSFTFQYMPDRDFVGPDSFALRASDGLEEQIYAVPIEISPIPHYDPGVPILPYTGPPASVGQMDARTPKDLARIALRTRDVKLLRRKGATSVYTARRAYEKGIEPAAGTRALAVTCAVRCRLKVRTLGLKSTRMTVQPGAARAIRLSRRAAAKLKRSGARRVAFEVGTMKVRLRTR